MKDDETQFFLKKIFFRLFAPFLLVGIFFLSQQSALAQQKNLTGTILGDDRAPIPGASIVVKGTTIGTVTDFNGKFTLTIPGTAKTLLVSFVGMQSKEILIGAGTVYNVTLSESTAGIEEVIVVGYGVQKKESVVGAVVQVGSESLMRTGRG